MVNKSKSHKNQHNDKSMHADIMSAFKGVQVSDHVIDWIRLFARAFFPDFKMPPVMINVYTIFSVDTKWPTGQMSRPWKILSSIYPLMSNKYKIHIQFNLVAYKSVPIVLRSG